MLVYTMQMQRTEKMKFIEKLLSENTDVSCMRFMSLFSLFAGSLISIIAVFQRVDLGSATPLVGVFVGAAFGGKVSQKYFEKAAKNVVKK